MYLSISEITYLLTVCYICFLHIYISHIFVHLYISIFKHVYCVFMFRRNKSFI